MLVLLTRAMTRHTCGRNGIDPTTTRFAPSALLCRTLCATRTKASQHSNMSERREYLSIPLTLCLELTLLHPTATRVSTTSKLRTSGCRCANLVRASTLTDDGVFTEASYSLKRYLSRAEMSGPIVNLLNARRGRFSYCCVVSLEGGTIALYPGKRSTYF